MKKYFELHRHIDGLVYQFDKDSLPDGRIGYKRRDQDLWIKYDSKIGWCAYSREDNELQGKPWNILIDKQSHSYPPEDIWVSKKGDKSYVYTLKYI